MILYEKKIRGYSFSDDIYSLFKHKNLHIFQPIYKTKTSNERNKLKKQERKKIKLSVYFFDNNNHITNQINIFKPETIFIVDDVVTTGTTMKEHILILQEKFPNIQFKGICLAG